MKESELEVELTRAETSLATLCQQCARPDLCIRRSMAQTKWAATPLPPVWPSGKALGR